MCPLVHQPNYLHINGKKIAKITIIEEYLNGDASKTIVIRKPH